MLRFVSLVISSRRNELNTSGNGLATTNTRATNTRSTRFHDRRRDNIILLLSSRIEDSWARSRRSGLVTASGR